MLENRLNGAVEVDILVDFRHERADTRRELFEHVKLRLRQIALIEPVARDDKVLKKAAVEEKELCLAISGLPRRVVKV